MLLAACCLLLLLLLLLTHATMATAWAVRQRAQNTERCITILVEFDLEVPSREVEAGPPGARTVLGLLPHPVGPVQPCALPNVSRGGAAGHIAELAGCCAEALGHRAGDRLAPEQMQLFASTTLPTAR